MKVVYRHIEIVKSFWTFLDGFVRFHLATMYNADPGLFAFYGNQRPPRNVPNYASPMGFQFSPRGYEQYVQNVFYPNVPQSGPRFPQQPIQDPAIIYAGRSNKRPFNPSERPAHTPNKKKKWQEPQLYGSNKINDKITEGIWDYFENYRQTDEMYRNKIRFRNALFAIFKDVFPYCGLYIVGSSMSGFGTKTSDMDLCLMLSPHQIDGKREAVELLMVIQRAFRKCPFIRRSQLIRARVPILKFEDSKTNVECDLNINNSVGIRNTHLLKYYANMDWRVRPLVLFVKKWARFHDINDASKKTISSYSLCLMVIHYLQHACGQYQHFLEYYGLQVECRTQEQEFLGRYLSLHMGKPTIWVPEQTAPGTDDDVAMTTCIFDGCSPPVVDSIQKLRPDLFNGDDIRDLRMTENIDFQSENSDSLGDLFLGFLEYYATKFNFVNDVASVRMGTRLPLHMVKRYTPMHEHNMWSCLKVEEPFDRSNTARSCYDAQTFERVIRVFKSSYRNLAQKRDLRSILSTPF